MPIGQRSHLLPIRLERVDGHEVQLVAVTEQLKHKKLQGRHFYPIGKNIAAHIVYSQIEGRAVKL